MFSAFFGHYLLNEKIVTKKQLEKALALQDKTHLKIGTMAINEGFMTVPQVEEVHAMQLTCDMRFGDLAVESEYLTEKQLKFLLDNQTSEHMILAQSLVDLDILDFENFDLHLKAYKKKHEFSNAAFEGLKSGNIDAIVTTFLSFEDDEQGAFYRDYITLFINNQVRFINSHIHLEEAKLITKTTYDHLIRQTIYGDKKYFTALAGDSASMTAFAGLYANEKFKVFGDYPIDAIGEYMNQNNGLFVVNNSNEGMEISLDIQTHIEAPILNPYKPLYDIPIHCTCGCVHLILGQL